MSAANGEETLIAPTTAVVLACHAAAGDRVSAGAPLAVLESMKMQIPVDAPDNGLLRQWHVRPGDTVEQGSPLCSFLRQRDSDDHAVSVPPATEAPEQVEALRQRLAKTSDLVRSEQADRRHAQGYRTARENLADLCDTDSFIEYGQLAVAAQRQRRSLEDLETATAADGIITGIGRIDGAEAVVIVNDYSVLAGTQGYFHHRKLDRALAIAEAQRLPVVMYTEGGGGRPGDTDVLTQVAGLELTSFQQWAALRGVVPRVAVNNGYCFAGNAALFGAADITIATRSSWIGMAGPAMIEGGGLGRVEPTAIGPIDEQCGNGVVDLVAADEADATALAKRALGFLRGSRKAHWEAAEQHDIGRHMPGDRRYAYDIRPLLAQLMDRDSLLELRADFGRAVLVGFGRLEGRPVGWLASNCRHLGGAIDAEAADKLADFVTLCGRFGLPVMSLVDTPGFMVGTDSERQAAVRRMARAFAEGAQAPVPWLAVMLRRGYGLGAMAMCGGSFSRPVYTAAWPMGEFGGMGLEGAVKLGFRKQLEAAEAGAERQALFDQLLAEAYERGKATEMAAHLELDAVIEPAQTRRNLVIALRAACS